MYGGIEKTTCTRPRSHVNNLAPRGKMENMARFWCNKLRISWALGRYWAAMYAIGRDLGLIAPILALQAKSDHRRVQTAYLNRHQPRKFLEKVSTQLLY